MLFIAPTLIHKGHKFKYRGQEHTALFNARKISPTAVQIYTSSAVVIVFFNEKVEILN